jgi:hypothetical protein
MDLPTSIFIVCASFLIGDAITYFFITTMGLFVLSGGVAFVVFVVTFLKIFKMTKE